jgi:hypothetical protein
MTSFAAGARRHADRSSPSCRREMSLRDLFAVSGDVWRLNGAPAPGHRTFATYGQKLGASGTAWQGCFVTRFGHAAAVALWGCCEPRKKAGSCQKNTYHGHDRPALIRRRREDPRPLLFKSSAWLARIHYRPPDRPSAGRQLVRDPRTTNGIGQALEAQYAIVPLGLFRLRRASMGKAATGAGAAREMKKWGIGPEVTGRGHASGELAANKKSRTLPAVAARKRQRRAGVRSSTARRRARRPRAPRRRAGG